MNQPHLNDLMQSVDQALSDLVAAENATGVPEIAVWTTIRRAAEDKINELVKDECA